MKQKRKKNIKGMTLTEVIAGISILLLASLFLASGFGVVIRVMHQADLIKNAGQLAAGVAEGGDNADRLVDDSGIVGGDVTLTLQNGSKIMAKGSYRTFSQGPGPYARFEMLDDTDDIAYTLWMQVKDAFAFGTALPAAERSKWGFNSWSIENDGLRRYMFQHVWNSRWPPFPSELFERNGIKDTTVYYIQPRFFRTAFDSKGEYDGDLCAITFANATNSATGNWYTRLVYDQTTRTWYYRLAGPISIVADSPPNPRGAKAVLEQVRNDPAWKALK